MELCEQRSNHSYQSVPFFCQGCLQRKEQSRTGYPRRKESTHALAINPAIKFSSELAQSCGFLRELYIKQTQVMQSIFSLCWLIMVQTVFPPADKGVNQQTPVRHSPGWGHTLLGAHPTPKWLLQTLIPRLLNLEFSGLYHDHMCRGCVLG